MFCLVKSCHLQETIGRRGISGLIFFSPCYLESAPVDGNNWKAVIGKSCSVTWLHNVLTKQCLLCVIQINQWTSIQMPNFLGNEDIKFFINTYANINRSKLACCFCASLREREGFQSEGCAQYQRTEKRAFAECDRPFVLQKRARSQRVVINVWEEVASLWWGQGGVLSCCRVVGCVVVLCCSSGSVGTYSWNCVGRKLNPPKAPQIQESDSPFFHALYTTGKVSAWADSADIKKKRKRRIIFHRLFLDGRKDTYSWISFGSRSIRPITILVFNQTVTLRTPFFQLHQLRLSAREL